MALYLGGKIDVGTNELPPKEATQMSREIKYIGMDVHKEAIVRWVFQSAPNRELRVLFVARTIFILQITKDFFTTR